MERHKTIFITGAGGFIGGRIAERLFLENLAEIRAGVKDWSGAARIGRFPIEIVKANIMDEKNLIKLMRGVDAVIHCAYGNRLVNERGTENLLKASLKSGVKRFIHFSTVEVYGNVSGEISESSPLKYSGREYADSKINAEKIVWEYQKRGLAITVLRPTVVYGPFCKPWTVNVAQRLLSGWKPPSDLNGFCSPVYVDDVVDAVILILGSEKAIAESFNIGGPQTITWNEFFQEFNKALNLPPLKTQNITRSFVKAVLMKPIRTTAGYLAKNHMDLIKKMCLKWPLLKEFVRKSENFIKMSTTTSELSLYRRRAIYSIEKARRVLGYNPHFDLEKGLQLTAAWLKHNGYEPLEEIKKLHHQ